MTDKEKGSIRNMLELLNNNIPVITHADCAAKSSIMFGLTELLNSSEPGQNGSAVNAAMAAAEAEGSAKSK